MRFHLRFPEDDWVDRPELEAQQCVEATGTNTPNKPTPGFSTNHTSNTVRVHYAVTDTTHPHCHNDISILIITITSTPKMCRWLIAAGKRPVPFRTRKLSPPAPMVLLPGGSGRVGYRRPNNFKNTSTQRQHSCCLWVFFHIPTPQQLRWCTPTSPQCRIGMAATRSLW